MQQNNWLVSELSPVSASPKTITTIILENAYELFIQPLASIFGIFLLP